MASRDLDPVGGYPAELAGAALSRAAELGAGYAEFRVQHTDRLTETVQDGGLVGSSRLTETGYGVRVLYDGTWGFAAGTRPAPEAVAETTRRAVELARATRPLRGTAVRLTAEPPQARAEWTSAFELDPFEVPAGRRVAHLAGWTDSLCAAGVDHATARLLAVREHTRYANSEGADIRQRRIWVHPMVTAVRVDRGAGTFDAMRTLAPPTARGWEYLDGTGWDWDTELAALPGLLAERASAPGVQPGRYDLVLHPSNLWLTIHETVGHATELDRALGHEAAFAGTTFATPERLGRLRFGSPAMTVTADRTTEYGLATVGYDDEGVAAQRWDLIRAGVLVGYQTDRQTAHRVGSDRSHGCAYADSFARPPMLRMPNVSLCPAPDGPSTDELVADVADGVYVLGDNSFSVDMQRLNFQFTGQRCYRIRHGRLAGPLRDFAYQGSTPQFWRSLLAVGGPGTFLLSGASMCGKGQPLQLSAAGHGCPTALFRGVQVRNTAGSRP